MKGPFGQRWGWATARNCRINDPEKWRSRTIQWDRHIFGYIFVSQSPRREPAYRRPAGHHGLRGLTEFKTKRRM